MAKQWIAGVTARTILCITLILMMFVSLTSLAENSRTNAAAAKATMLAAPLSFETNQGQTDSTVKFISHGDGFMLFLTPDKAVFKLRQSSQKDQASVLTMQIVGANTRVQVSAIEELLGKANYFIGNDPSQWHTNVATYKKVKYQGIYPGVDAVFYGNQRQMEYDFAVAPGQNPAQIALAFSGAQPQLDAQGNLLLKTDGGEVTLHKPVVYQNFGSKKIAVEGGYQIADGRVRFNIGAYDHSKTLVIDPTITYLTYLGGTLADNIGELLLFNSTGTQNPSQGLGIDGNGNAYVVGSTFSTDFPVANAVQPTGRNLSGHPTVFVSKLSADGSSLLYSTYLSGTVFESGNAIAVDAAGNAYVVGSTNSPDFPVTAGAFQTACGASVDGSGNRVSSCGFFGPPTGFLTKLTPAGSIAYSTYLGGVVLSTINSVAVDSKGQAYVAGSSLDFCHPTDPPFYCFPTTADAVIPGTATTGSFSGMAFVSVFNPTGSALLYSTYFGDTVFSSSSFNVTNGNGVAVDANGNFYLTGVTLSPNLPVTSGAFETANHNGPVAVGYVAKFSPAGSSSVTQRYATYLEAPTASLGEYPADIVADSDGNAYVTGTTASPNFPVTVGAYQTSCTPGSSNQCNSGFVSKIKPDGSGLVWSTLIGDVTLNGVGSNGPVGSLGPIALDQNRNVYIAGLSDASFPQINPVQTSNGGAGQALVVKLDADGSKAHFASVVGSGGVNGTQNAAGIAVDQQGSIYLAGNTNSTGLAVTSGAFQQEFAGGTGNGGDGFIAKINPFVTSSTSEVISPTTANVGQNVSFEATVLGSPGGLAPTGTVSFNNGGTVLGTATLDTNGVGNFTTSSLTQGTYSVVAVYSGDNTYASSSSAAQTLTINAVVIPPTAPTISPNPAAFGSQTENTTVSIPVTVKNVGTAGLTITSVTPATSGDFTQTNNCVTTLIPNATCTVTVSFKPTSTVGQNVTFTVTDNAGTQNFSATGTGTAAAAPKVTLSKTALTFASQNIGTTSVAQTFTITNSGNATLNFTSILASGDFALSKDCAASLTASNFCTVSVTFSPTATGTRTGAVTIIDNAGTQTVSLTGTGTVGAPKLSWSVVGQGTQSTGVMFVDVRVTNIGTGIADSVKVMTLTLRTVTGTGTPTLDPASVKPVISLPNLAVGATATVHLLIDVPSSATRFTVTETGTVQDFAGTNYSYSGAEVITK